MSHLNVVPIRPDEPDITASSVVSDDTDIRGLVPGGHHIDDAVPFASDIWDLRGHQTWKSKQGSQTALNFSKVPLLWRTAVKEWALLQLNPDLATMWAPGDPIAQTWPQNQEPTRPVTVQSNLKQLTVVLAMLDKYGLHQPDSDGWGRALALMRQPQSREDKLKGAVLSPGTLRGRAQNVTTFWSIRSIVGRHDMLGSEPFDGVETSVLFGSRGRPKRNARRPHEDVGRTLGFVAWVFDNLAEDILAHLRWWHDNRLPAHEVPASREEGKQEMLSLLHDIVQQHGAMPASNNKNGNPTLTHTPLAWLLGVDDADVAFAWGRYAAAQFKGVPLDLKGASPCPVPIRNLPRVDGSGDAAWADRLLFSRGELQWWASAIVYYAMLYIAATCGLRDLDLEYLPRGCLKRTTKTRPTGEQYEVAEIRGYKQKNRNLPVQTSWVVNGRIARIIDVVEQLHDLYGLEPSLHPQTGEARLFDSRLIVASKRTQRDSLHIDLHFTEWLKKGAQHLHSRGLISDDLSNLEKVSSATVRITALQAYAARPLGNALAAAYGQWSSQNVAMGYHGDVYKILHLADPLDAAEHQQEYIGRTLATAAQNIDQMKGNGVPRLQRTLTRNHKTLANPAPLSESRLKRLGRDNPNVEVGPLTICVYNSEGALCGGRGAADFRLCRPFECRNSAMTPGQRARVELRRRLEAAGSDIQRRSARKLAEGMPEIIEEFKDMTDDELVRMVAQETEDYIVQALGLAEEDGA